MKLNSQRCYIKNKLIGQLWIEKIKSLACVTTRISVFSWRVQKTTVTMNQPWIFFIYKHDMKINRFSYHQCKYAFVANSALIERIIRCSHQVRFVVEFFGICLQILCENRDSELWNQSDRIKSCGRVCSVEYLKAN